jgi:hypothetical protein
MLLCKFRLLSGGGWKLRCYELLCGEWWEFVMGYCAVSGGNLLCVIVWQVVGICYGLLCGKWWEFVMGYCVGSGGNFYGLV